MRRIHIFIDGVNEYTVDEVPVIPLKSKEVNYVSDEPVFITTFLVDSLDDVMELEEQIINVIEELKSRFM